MPQYVKLASCSLSQWALDFDGNYERILQSIRICKQRNVKYRLGPELEVCGYGCNDHFLENDTFIHSWEVISKLIVQPECQDILLDIGMPVIHRSTKYNCRIIILNTKILLIRPKLFMANDGNYRELRWFTSWNRPRIVEDHVLPDCIRRVTGQETARFGDGVIETNETCIGTELCEELFTPNSPHIHMGLDGIEIFTNGSASHHELRKLNRRIDLITHATSKIGGIYVYSNQQGCDGERLYFDGSSLIAINGKIVAQGTQFSLSDVEVVDAVVDLDDVQSYRGYSRSIGAQTNSSAISYPRIKTDFSIEDKSKVLVPSAPIQIRYHTPEEEISLGPACWLWDYLRRSGLKGFFIPLSGGIDSCSTALIVYSMCRLIVDAAEKDTNVLKDIRTIVEDQTYTPKDPRELAGRILYTAYMGSEQSSTETKARANDLSKAIGSYHIDFSIDTVVHSIITIFQVLFKKTPKFKVNGGSNCENMALQNIQARVRMILSYFLAQLGPWFRNGSSNTLLVLSCANVDECLRGYFTKYDCSSGDLNPIGGLSKGDLNKFVLWAKTEFDLPILEQFLQAIPSAELEPITPTYKQTDEEDMGFSYKELSIMGKLRKIDRCGPVSMFSKLIHLWPAKDLTEIADKVKKFFRYYGANRHKMTVSTPAYHAEPYSPDDHRFDLRPFLYPFLGWQYRNIDKLTQS